MTSLETLEDVIKWNRRALKKAQGEKDIKAVARYEANIAHLEQEKQHISKGE